MLPLEGLTVIALEQAVAAPFATRQLADLGARIVKIERPGSGDFARAYDRTVHGLSSHFVWLNRSKESLTLDLKRDEAREVVERLLSRADVFVQNLAPGAADRLGFGAAVLRRRYPRLIVCDISGFGSTGPYRDKKAYDLLVQAESGLVSITGTEHAPVKVAISVADIAAAMYAYSGILSALLMRQRTGEGTALEVSLLESLGEWMGYPLYYTTYGGSPPPRSGARHAAIAPYGPFAGREGGTIYLGVQNDREWVAFCRAVLQRPELASDERFATNSSRVSHLTELQEEIDRVFRTLTAADILERLDRAQIANARINSVQEFADHGQLIARNRWRRVETPVGPVRALVPPVTMEGVEPVMQRIPSVGEHTDAILIELGYERATIETWRRNGII